MFLEMASNVIANNLGLAATTAYAFADDVLSPELRLDSPNEIITGCLALSGAHTHELQHAIKTHGNGSWRSTKDISNFHDKSLAEILELLFEESPMRECDTHASRFTLAPGDGARQDLGSQVVDLPPPERHGFNTEAILSNRTSIRDFANCDVDLRSLATILYHAQEGDANDRSRRFVPVQLAFYIVSRGIRGLEQGVWIYDPEHHVLRHGRSALSQKENAELYIQDPFADAPLQILVVGNLAAATASHGAWGHRNLLVRSGIAAQRMWFAAAGAGLDGAIVAGLVPGAMRSILGFDGYQRTGLIGIVAGLPKPEKNKCT